MHNVGLTKLDPHMMVDGYRPECNVYKLSSISVESIGGGREVFRFLFNGNVRAGMLVRRVKNPHSALASFNSDLLNIMYAKNKDSIQDLVGKYISGYVAQTPYGLDVKHIYSLDVLADFDQMLRKSGGKAFSTQIDVHTLLLQKGRPCNEDGSIALNGPHSSMRIASVREINICYTHNESDNFLNRKNAEIIFDKFYKGKKIDTMNDDRNEEYILSVLGVAISCTTYPKDGRPNNREHNVFPVLYLGDALNEEQVAYLTSLPRSGLQV